MNTHDPIVSMQENLNLATKQAIFYKKMAANMRTQANALRALLISLNIPEEEIDNAQYAHIRISNIADAFTEPGDASTSAGNTGYII